MNDNPLTIQSDLAAALPHDLQPRPRHATLDPDDLPTDRITDTSPTTIDGEPQLLDPDAPRTVTPLDLARATHIVETRRHLWDGADYDEAPFRDEPEPVRIRDSRKRYAFDGVRLSFVSSEKSTKTRWTEISVYRTAGGLYVVHTVGVSTLAHAHNPSRPCRWLNIRKYAVGIDAIAADETGIEDRDPCPDCQPNIPALRHTDPASLLFERDVHTVTIHQTPENAIQSLYTTRDGVRALGPLAISALQIAADRDPVLASVYYGERHNTHQ